MKYKIEIDAVSKEENRSIFGTIVSRVKTIEDLLESHGFNVDVKVIENQEEVGSSNE